MEISFSRHAKRRLRLYSVGEDEVAAALERGMIAASITGTRGVLIDESFAERHGFPVKIVFDIQHAGVIVITAYPLKKGL